MSTKNGKSVLDQCISSKDFLLITWLLVKNGMPLSDSEMMKRCT